MSEAVLTKFLDLLFPSLELLPHSRGPNDNAIEQRSAFIFGGQSEGKSDTAIYLVEKAVERYGTENVSAQTVQGENLREALDGWQEGKLVQIKVVENLTNVRFKEDEIRDLFRIREKMADHTGVREGLCILLATGHRFFDVPIAFRYDPDFFIIKSLPTNKHDRDFVRNLISEGDNDIGEKNLKILTESEMHRLEEPERKGECFITYKTQLLGFTKMPKSSLAVEDTRTEQTRDSEKPKRNGLDRLWF